jgi:hypothetical protein
LILIPNGDVDIAIDVVEFNAPIGIQSVSLMKFLRKLAAMSGGGLSDAEQRKSGYDNS